MRFVFSPPAEPASALVALPWELPLEQWPADLLVEIPQSGRARHVVRFVAESGQVFALKELPEPAARREYRVLRHLAEVGIPAVEVIGVVVDRPAPAGAALVTRFLEYSSSFLSLFANPRCGQLTGRVMNAQVELLVRLHLAGVVWGDCSLSNTLFRFDAGVLTAHLVDAETGEVHEALTERQRDTDIEIAYTRVVDELTELRRIGSLSEDTEPALAAADLVARYEQLWAALSNDEVIGPHEQRFRITERIRRLQALDFDVDQLELVDEPGGGSLLRLTTRVAEPGHHRLLLFARTGLHVQENQARRLLGDIAAYRAWLQHAERRPVPEAVAAARWLNEVYDPALAAVPDDLRRRMDDAEIYHELLEHRWFLSEAAGRDVGTEAAVRDYVERVLPAVPAGLLSRPPEGLGRGRPAPARS
ncbi:DUF4032 domain-containing protein [Geodermatophilus sp. SYSU D00815]